MPRTSDEISQLDLFLTSKKFTTSAMSFFLAKVREGTVAARHAVSASYAPTPPLPTPLSAYEIARRSRKARRPLPPPGCLPSPGPRSPPPRSVTSAQHYARAAAAPTAGDATLGGASDCISSDCISSTGGGCAWFCPLERRLEEEMEAARARESAARETALHAAVKQRSEAISSERDDVRTSPPATPDGPQTYYERRAIEEWLMSQSLARCRSRR